MLTNTFCHLPGIGPRTEARLWASGVKDWNAFEPPFPAGFPERLAGLQAQIAVSKQHLAGGDPGFFARRLPPGEHWRLFPEFRGQTAFLDIETTGMASGYDHITTIALYDGRQLRWYVHGHNLDRFKDDIGAYRLLVTYNGKGFDVPFIESDLGLRLEAAHIDLRYVLAGLGLRGGLKRCEQQLGLSRGSLAGVDGFFAVLLWQRYRRYGDRKALETLLAYNIQDTLSLETLMIEAYNRKLAATPFAQSRRLAPAPAPSVPFAPHSATIAQIRRQRYAAGF